MEVEGQHDDGGSEGCQSDGGDRDTVCPEDDDPGFDAGDAECGEGSEVDGPPLAPVERPRRGATQFCKAFKECTECGEELKPTDKLYKTTNSHHGCGTGVLSALRSLALEDTELVESLKLMRKSDPKLYRDVMQDVLRKKKGAKLSESVKIALRKRVEKYTTRKRPSQTRTP